MQYKDAKRFAGLNTDDAGEFLPPDDFTSAKNVRTLSSSEQHGSGNLETLQSEIPVPLLPDDLIMYYGEAIGYPFIYSGFAEVTIGTQVWMKKNWDAEYPGSRLYDDSEGNEAIYGRLYTHNQIMQSDFCPEGWRVPTMADYEVLFAYLGGDAVAGGKMKNVGTALWESLNVGADDSSGFRAVPGGKFDTAYELLKLNGLFWVADDGCPLAPVILNASEITHESFVANWKASDGATGYYLDVSESPTFASFMMGYEDKDVGNVLYSLVEDLEPFTTYYFRLRAYNEHCFSGYSLTGTLKTLSMLQDIDHNNYHTKIIGNKEWIIENFRATHYKNGDDIQLVTDPDIWANGVPTDVTKDIYGALYNWWAASKSGGTGLGSIAPAGWHVPNMAEVLVLVNYIGGRYKGGDLKEIGLTHWNEPNIDATNITGFTALGSGKRYGVTGQFVDLKEGFDAALLDEDPYDNTVVIVMNLVHASNQVSPNIVGYGVDDKTNGNSIRCLMDDPSGWQEGDTVTDIDGNEYATCQIGTQVWMAENLKVEHFNDNTEIPIVSDNTAWAALSSEGMCYYSNASTENILDGFYCWYNNDSASYKEVYGALYNWLAVDHASELVYFEREGVEETGWRVPSRADYLEMLMTVDPNFLNNALNVVGGLLKEAGLTRWNTPNAGAVDYVGFTAVGAGSRHPSTGAFGYLKEGTAFWTTTNKGAPDPLEYFVLYLSYLSLAANIGSAERRTGLSVRCVRDLTTPPTDRSQIGDAEFRIIVRDGHLCWDQAITGLGFNGVQDQDWINLKMIP
jgi:uncharacterized protein (TIGR02145 family)